MKLEDQVCAFEQSKRLKELGVKQDSLWSWQTKPKAYQTDFGEYLQLGEAITDTTFGAFTVAELGEMLPYGLCLSSQNMDKWYCAYYEGKQYSTNRDRNHKHTTWADTEAEARAAMLIYLLENTNH